MIYLDHAATSFPKPEPVLAAMDRWLRHLGVSAERGDSPAREEVAGVVADARRRLARLCGVDERRLAFTSGATEALNLALRGVLRQGDRVVTTELEHASLVRPLLALRGPLGLAVEVLAADADGRIPLAAAAAALARAPTRLLAFSHASNVHGAVQPAAELCSLARSQDCTSLLDASQTAGALPIAVGADIVVASAHKALHGPPGLGFLAAGDDIALTSHKQGGTGSARALEQHPEQWPHALEAGTPNTPAIFGLQAALCWLEGRPQALPGQLRLVDQLRAALVASGVATCHGPDAGPRTAVLSFCCSHLDSAEAGVLLAEAGIHARTGHHCAPWVHRALGTEHAGTIRISPGPTNTEADMRAVLAALGIDG